MDGSDGSIGDVVSMQRVGAFRQIMVPFSRSFALFLPLVSCIASPVWQRMASACIRGFPVMDREMMCVCLCAVVCLASQLARTILASLVFFQYFSPVRTRTYNWILARKNHFNIEREKK